MTTKTDYQSLLELKDFTPVSRGFICGAEGMQIEKALELKTRSNIELQNIRDMAVMIFGRWIEEAEEKGNTDAVMQKMDVMSAVCCVIDQEKWKHGMEV